MKTNIEKALGGLSARGKACVAIVPAIVLAIVLVVHHGLEPGNTCAARQWRMSVYEAEGLVSPANHVEYKRAFYVNTAAWRVMSSDEKRDMASFLFDYYVCMGGQERVFIAGGYELGAMILIYSTDHRTWLLGSYHKEDGFRERVP